MMPGVGRLQGRVGVEKKKKKRKKIKRRYTCRCTIFRAYVFVKRFAGSDVQKLPIPLVRRRWNNNKRFAVNVDIFVSNHGELFVRGRGRRGDSCRNVFGHRRSWEYQRYNFTLPYATPGHELTRWILFNVSKDAFRKVFTVYKYLFTLCVRVPTWSYTCIVYKHWRVIYTFRHEKLCVLG